MIYVGTKENAPHCTMPAPYQRELYCLLSPSLDPTQHDLAVGMVEIPAGSTSDWRAHEEGEMFFVVSGHGHMRVGEEVIALQPDMALYVPGGVPHQSINDSPSGEVLKELFVLTPPFGGDRSIIENARIQQEG